MGKGLGPLEGLVDDFRFYTCDLVEDRRKLWRTEVSIRSYSIRRCNRGCLHALGKYQQG